MELTSIHTVFFSGLFVLVALRVHSFTEQTKLVHYSGYIDNGGLKGHKKGTIADSYPFQFHLGARGGGVVGRSAQHFCTVQSAMHYTIKTTNMTEIKRQKWWR